MRKLISNFEEITEGRPTRYEATDFDPENAVIDLENKEARVAKDETGSMFLRYQDESIPIDDEKALGKFFCKQGYLPKGSHMKKEMLNSFRQCVRQSHLIGINT